MSDENIHFQVIITDNGNGSCQGATCPRFMSFKVCEHILVVKIKQQILQKFISLCNWKENTQLINIVNNGKEKKRWEEQNEINAKEKRSKREKCYSCSRTFYGKGYPQEPNDLVVVLKFCRHFFNP